MLQVGDLVKVHPSLLKNDALSIPHEKISGLLVVNAEDGEWFGFRNLEVKNSDGETFGLLETSLEAV